MATIQYNGSAIAAKKSEAMYLVERELHAVASMLTHRCFESDPTYYTDRAEWAKADALDMIERYQGERRLLSKFTINIAINEIVGKAAWNALRDRR